MRWSHLHQTTISRFLSSFNLHIRDREEEEATISRFLSGLNHEIRDIEELFLTKI